MTARSRSPRPSGTVATFTGTATVFAIAGLAFMFGFGNGYLVGVQLGAPGWIAPMVAPGLRQDHPT